MCFDNDEFKPSFSTTVESKPSVSNPKKPTLTHALAMSQSMPDEKLRMLSQSSIPHEPVEEDAAYVLLGPNIPIENSKSISPRPRPSYDGLE